VSLLDANTPSQSPMHKLTNRQRKRERALYMNKYLYRFIGACVICTCWKYSKEIPPLDSSSLYFVRIELIITLMEIIIARERFRTFNDEVELF